MGGPLSGISREELLSWPAASARELIVSQQQQMEQLLRQLAALATELASLRDRVGRSSRNSFSHPRLMGLALRRLSGAKAVAVSAAASRVTPVPGLRSCRWSGLTRWLGLTLNAYANQESHSDVGLHFGGTGQDAQRVWPSEKYLTTWKVSMPAVCLCHETRY